MLLKIVCIPKRKLLFNYLIFHRLARGDCSPYGRATLEYGY